jgi:serine/threonine-protein kinase
MDRLPLLPVPRLLRIFGRVASAVASLHARGIVHADLKPNNLILDHEADVKVIDFGIARLRGEHTAQPHATRDYMAPETAAHKRIDELTDVYSFGATMYRLATLHAPPSALTAVVKGGQAFEHELRPARDHNPRVPEPLSDLIQSCLQVDPAHRPRSMATIAMRLGEMACAVG